MVDIINECSFKELICEIKNNTYYFGIGILYIDFNYFLSGFDIF